MEREALVGKVEEKKGGEGVRIGGGDGGGGQAAQSFRQLPPEPWLPWRRGERKQRLPRRILLG